MLFVYGWLNIKQKRHRDLQKFTILSYDNRLKLFENFNWTCKLKNLQKFGDENDRHKPRQDLFKK